MLTGNSVVACARRHQNTSLLSTLPQEDESRTPQAAVCMKDDRRTVCLLVG